MRNIREGVFWGKVLKKTEIPLIFVETIIREDIPANSCAINSFIHLMCMGTALFLWFLIH